MISSIGPKRSKKIWDRFRDTYGSQIEKHLRVFLASVEIINMRCCEKKRENSFLFKFKLPVSLRILYIPFSVSASPSTSYKRKGAKRQMTQNFVQIARSVAVEFILET